MLKLKTEKRIKNINYNEGYACHSFNDSTGYFSKKEEKRCLCMGMKETC